MDIMSVDQAQRIDIYKGAQPVLFGNGAFGVVNVVTKRQTEEGFYTNVRAGYGSYSTFIQGVEHGGKVGNTDYYLLQSFRSSSGHRDYSSGELQEYFARVGHQLNAAWYMSLTANATNNFAEDPGPEGNPAARQGTYRSNDEMTVITLAHQYSSVRGTLKLYWNRGTGDWQDQRDPAGFFYDTTTDWDNYGARLQETVTPWKNGEILGGIDLDFIGGKVAIDRDAPRADSTFPRETFRILSPYAALSHLFGEKSGWYAIPSAGVRYFSHSDFDAEWGPQAGFVMGYGSTEFHASYARGVNYPGVYVVTQSNLFWGGNTRWKNLDAETVDHYEAGLSHTIGKKFRADITYFTDDGKNRMILVTSPAPPRYENIGDFRTKGIEATVDLDPSRRPVPLRRRHAPLRSIAGQSSLCTQLVGQRRVQLPVPEELQAQRGRAVRGQPVHGQQPDRRLRGKQHRGRQRLFSRQRETGMGIQSQDARNERRDLYRR